MDLFAVLGFQDDVAVLEGLAERILAFATDPSTVLGDILPDWKPKHLRIAEQMGIGHLVYSCDTLSKYMPASYAAVRGRC